jgi:hypothetical protein
MGIYYIFSPTTTSSALPRTNTDVTPPLRKCYMYATMRGLVMTGDRSYGWMPSSLLRKRQFMSDCKAHSSVVAIFLEHRIQSASNRNAKRDYVLGGGLPFAYRLVGMGLFQPIAPPGDGALTPARPPNAFAALLLLGPLQW